MLARLMLARRVHKPTPRHTSTRHRQKHATKTGVCACSRQMCVYMLKTDVCVYVETDVYGYSQDTHRCTNVAHMSKLIYVL